MLTGRSLASWCVGLVLLAWVAVLPAKSEDVGEVEERATAFSGEVLGRVVLSGVGVLSVESGDVDEVKGRTTILVSWCWLGLRSYLGRVRISTKDLDEVPSRGGGDDVLGLSSSVSLCLWSCCGGAPWSRCVVKGWVRI